MTEDQKRDKYYIKKYAITLARYNTMFALQDGKCAICRRPQSDFSKRFSVDHDHAWKKVVITYLKDRQTGYWQATAEYCGDQFIAHEPTKPLAAKTIKYELKRRSVRGLLCWADNTALQKFRDNPERMEAAAQYLRKHRRNSS